MGLTFAEKDLVPIDGYAFQNWGARVGMPFDVMRPLSEEAAGRMWRRAVGLVGAERGFGAELDLGAAGEWTVAGVREWLLGRQGERGQVVVAVYHPQWAVAMEWGVVCDYWLTVLWAEAAVVGAGWVMHHDGERFRYWEGERDVKRGAAVLKCLSSATDGARMNTDKEERGRDARATR